MARTPIPVIFVAFLASAWVGEAHAQVCRPPTTSDEAKLLAFYAAPLAFSLPSAPTVTELGGVLVSVDVVPVGRPDPSIETTSICYPPRQQNSHLASVFARPRLAIGLPFGLVAEASYLPPIKVGDAKPNLGSLALSEVRQVADWSDLGSLTLAVRAHTTFGQVNGPITCAANAIQTTDPASPCYSTHTSDDRFVPTMFGGEAALGLTTLRGLLAVYAGGGFTWLRPRLQVGFTDAHGNTDHTRVEVDLTRGTVFGGVTARPWRGLELSAQVYSVPADTTTWRFALGYRLR